jgi:hypothetical protein
MPKSNADRQKAYRQKQIEKMGIEEYRKQQREKAAARRLKAKAQVQAVQAEVKEDPLVAQVLAALAAMTIEVAAAPELKQRVVKETIERVKVAVEKFTIDKSCADIIQAIIDHSKAVGDPVKPASLKGYWTKIKTLYNRYTGGVWNCRDFEWLRDTQAVLGFIASHNRWKKTSKWGYINAVTSILSRVKGYDDVYKIYSDANKAGLDEYLSKREENILSPEQEANILPWSKVMRLSPPEDLKERLMFELERWIPRRSGTYRIMKWTRTHNTHDNYFHIGEDKNTMVLNKYKTDKTYGRYEVAIPRRTSALIIKVIRANNIREGEYIFGKSDGTERSQSNFSTWFTDVMDELTNGKRMGTTLMRISYASWAVREYPSVKQQKIVATNLGHSVDQLRLYAKVDLV